MTETVIEQIGTGAYAGSSARAFMYIGGPQQIILERSIAVGNLTQGMWLDKARPTIGAVFRDVVINRGAYGIGADGMAEGTAGLSAGAPGFVWQQMTLIGPTVSSYPAGTAFVASESAASLSATIRSLVNSATAGVVIP